MSWIKFRARVKETNEDLVLNNIEPNNPDLIWTDKAVRSEDIAEFEQISPTTLLISFYNEYRIIAKGKVEDLMISLQKEEYDKPTEEDALENAIQ